MMCEQNEKYERRDRNYKKNQTNSGVKIYNNWTEKFITVIQQQT